MAKVDARRSALASARNRAPILDVLQRVLPAGGSILETSSGTGEHAIYFAPALAPRVLIPSEPDPTLRHSVAARCRNSTADNLQAPLDLDVTAVQWPVEREPLPEPPITAILSINMIHIAPWKACLGLMAGARRILGPGGVLYLYGPFAQVGGSTAASNVAFDSWLRSENPEWGVRSLQAVVDAAAAEDLTLLETVAMPADNLSLIFERR